LGTTIAERYTLLERLGAGGMSIVYRARQSAMDRDVAVKILPRERLSLEAVGRFHREMQACARLAHPNCVQVFDFGQVDEGLLYLVMELVDGETIGARLRREGRLALAGAAHIGAQIARAVAAAHALGFVHRDLKPDNVMLTRVVGDKHLVKVVDFGLVHATGDDVWQPLTHPGTFAGTPRYASPEQARAESVGPASDLYALGLILFELLAGRLPNDLDAEDRHAERLHAATGGRVPREIDELVASMLERDPARRPASAEEVARRLDAFDAPTREGAEAYAGSTSPVGGDTSQARRIQILVGVLAVAVLALAGVIALLVVWLPRSSEGPHPVASVVKPPPTSSACTGERCAAIRAADLLHVDAIEVLPQARRLAASIDPGADLIFLSVNTTSVDGTVDVTKPFAALYYQFQSKTTSLEVISTQSTLVAIRIGTRLAGRALSDSPCSARAAWKAAVSKGAPKTGNSVLLNLDDSGPLGITWSVTVQGDRTYLVDARTCAPRW
jgi:serine/threonine-protein kinase